MKFLLLAVLLLATSCGTAKVYVTDCKNLADNLYECKER